MWIDVLIISIHRVTYASSIDINNKQTEILELKGKKYYLPAVMGSIIFSGTAWRWGRIFVSVQLYCEHAEVRSCQQTATRDIYSVSHAQIPSTVFCFFFLLSLHITTKIVLSIPTACLAGFLPIPPTPALPRQPYCPPSLRLLC